MSGAEIRFTGGCLCGALRYAVQGTPLYMGHCYCADCRRASGSGFIPFIGVASTAVHFAGATHSYTSKSASGTDAVRNSCAVCASLVFGGVVGKDTSHTIYAGTLDDPALFEPKIAIFTRGRPSWAIIPPGLTVYEAMPS